MKRKPPLPQNTRERSTTSVSPGCKKAFAQNPEKYLGKKKWVDECGVGNEILLESQRIDWGQDYITKVVAQREVKLSIVAPLGRNSFLRVIYQTGFGKPSFR